MSEGFWKRKEDGGAFSPRHSTPPAPKANILSGRDLQNLLVEELVRLSRRTTHRSAPNTTSMTSVSSLHAGD